MGDKKLSPRRDITETEVRMDDNEKQEPPRKALIKDQLRRSFDDKAAEELPPELTSLIERLREQDNEDGK